MIIVGVSETLFDFFEIFSTVSCDAKRVKALSLLRNRVFEGLGTYILELVCCKNNRVEVEEVCDNSLKNSVVFLFDVRVEIVISG